MTYRLSHCGALQNTVNFMAFCLVLCMAPASQVRAQMQEYPAPIERRLPAPHPRPSPSAPNRQGIQGEHLAEWMNQHSTLTPEQQQQALEHEPGFATLPKNTQQRVLNRLAQLDAMNPRQRERVIARTEAMERLNPEQRSEVRGAMAQLGGLPQPERRVVAQTFRALRELPPEQRIQAYASGRYGTALNTQQQAILFNLLKVEPLLPPPTSSMAPPQNIPGSQAFH